MSAFSPRSLANLAGVHPRLVQLLTDVTQAFDCSIIGGLRTIEEQGLNVAKGLSRTLASKHLKQPDGYGHAVDVAPTPQQWDNSPPSGLSKYDVECIAFLFYLKGFAKAQGLDVRIGADWNGNNLWTDNTFNDLDHVELAHNEPVPTTTQPLPQGDQ